jgi:excisionase family DNA binding protein
MTISDMRPARGSALTPRDMDELPAALDLATACRGMNISRSKGYDMLRAGTFPLPALRIGSQWRFRTSDLRRYLGLDAHDGQHTVDTQAVTSNNSAADGLLIRQGA